MGKVVVIGSSNTDMVVRSPKMPLPGETILGGEFDIIPGGKGANQAVAAARAGGEVTFISKVGSDDFGKQAVTGYAKDGINTECILIDENTPSGVAIIIVDSASGENSIVVAPGSNARLTPNNIQSFEDIITKADVLLVQLEIPVETVAEALRIAKLNNVKTILNPAPAQHLSDEILSMVDIITPNESETNILIGLEPYDDNTTKNAARCLIEKVNESAIITLGSKGVYVLSKSGENEFVPTSKVNAIDTTAAGDTFNGYLAAEIASGKNLIEAITLANKAAAISVTKKGAQPSIPFINDIV